MTSLTLQKSHTLFVVIIYTQSLLLQVYNLACNHLLMSPSMIGVDVLLHPVKPLSVLRKILQIIRSRSRFEHLIQFFVILMELLLFISFHSIAYCVQSSKALLTFDALCDKLVFPLQMSNNFDYINNVQHFIEQYLVILIYQPLSNAYLGQKDLLFLLIRIEASR